jgi:hypothetical protein
MVCKGRTFDPRFAAAMVVIAISPWACAGEDRREPSGAQAAPLEIPHALNVLLAEMSRRQGRKPDNIESLQFLKLTPGLSPVVWPHNYDMRARILTPELKATPVFGWLAENLYRSRQDNGWSLELDPGGGEYLVFYRYHLR